MDDISDVKAFYERGDGEESRLERHQLERDITLRFFDEYDRHKTLREAFERLQPGGLISSALISRYGILGHLLANYTEWIEKQSEVRSIEEPLYRDGRHYDLLQANLTEDIAFYVQQARQFGPPILELACGTGRITIPIAQQGFEIVGIDKSEKMLARAKEKAGNQYPITWHLGDIRAFDFKRKFKLIIFPFNSIAHLHDLASIGACFKSVRDHLDDDGRFVLDIFNPNLMRLIKKEDETPRVVSEYPDPDSDHQVVITETNRYDRASQINYITWHYQIGDRQFTHALNMRIFYPQELDALLLNNGFMIEHKYGDFDQSPFTSESQGQIVVCKLTRE